MKIGGLQKFSLLDYPGHLAVIIFTQGCNFRCQFCYNPMLVWPIEVGKFKDISSADAEENKKVFSLIRENDLFDFLEKRVGKVDAVVITGGEPTIHEDLPEFIAKIKKLGFEVKLDTNGTNPEMIKELIKNKQIDYIAMDVKGPENKYDLIAGAQPDLNKIKESIKAIKASGLPYEFRTTVVPNLLNLADIKAMGELIRGADKWYLQKFKSDVDLVNEQYKYFRSYSDKEMEKLRKAGAKFVKECGVR